MKNIKHVYNKTLGQNGIRVCFKIDDQGDTPQVTVYVQENGPLGLNCVGKSLGFGCGPTIDEAISDAFSDALGNVARGER